MIVVVLNLSKTVRYTAEEVNSAEKSSEGSPAAIVGGTFYLLGFSSSLYHLVLLSGHQVYAVAFPIRYRLRSACSTYVGLVVVWILAITASTFPRKFLFISFIQDLQLH